MGHEGGNDLLASLKLAVFYNLQVKIFQWKNNSATGNFPSTAAAAMSATYCQRQNDIFHQQRFLILPEQVHVSLGFSQKNIKAALEQQGSSLQLYPCRRTLLNPGGSICRVPFGPFLKVICGTVSAKSEIYKKLDQQAYLCTEELCRNHHLIYKKPKLAQAKILGFYDEDNIETLKKKLPKGNSANAVHGGGPLCPQCGSETQEVIPARYYQKLAYIQVKLFKSNTVITLCLKDNLAQKTFQIGEEVEAFIQAAELLTLDGKPNLSPIYRVFSIYSMWIPFRLQAVPSTPLPPLPAEASLLKQMSQFFDFLPDALFMKRSPLLRELNFSLFISVLSNFYAKNLVNTSSTTTSQIPPGFSVLIITEEPLVVKRIVNFYLSALLTNFNSIFEAKLDNDPMIKLPQLPNIPLKGSHLFNSQHGKPIFIESLLDYLPVKDLKWIYDALSGGVNQTRACCWAMCTPNFKYLPKNILKQGGSSSKIGLFNMTTAFDLVIDLSNLHCDGDPDMKAWMMDFSPIHPEETPFCSYLKVNIFPYFLLSISRLLFISRIVLK